MTIEVEKFLRAIGPFYELVDEKKKISQVSDLSAGTWFCVLDPRRQTVNTEANPSRSASCPTLSPFDKVC